MSDRVLRFPDRTWDELEGLPSAWSVSGAQGPPFLISSWPRSMPRMSCLLNATVGLCGRIQGLHHLPRGVCDHAQLDVAPLGQFEAGDVSQAGHRVPFKIVSVSGA